MRPGTSGNQQMSLLRGKGRTGKKIDWFMQRADGKAGSDFFVDAFYGSIESLYAHGTAVFY